jgi:hypothetical protein
MILIKKLTIVTCFFALAACSSINSAKVADITSKNGIINTGQIISIETKKVDASFSKRSIGSLIGHFVAQGIGANSRLKFVSAVVGSAIAKKEYSEFVDLIEVQSEEGQRYKTFVPMGYFSLNEKVDFINEKTTVTTIARIKRNAE